MLLGLVLCAAAVLLTARIGVRVTGTDGDVQVIVRYGAVRLRLYPRRRLKKSGQKTASKPAKKPKKAPEKPPLSPENKPDWGDTLCLILDFLDDCRDILRIDTLRADILLATGDAAKTGILLGQCAALLGMITPFLENTFSIRDYHIAVDGNFQSDTPHWDAVLQASVRPARLLWLLWKQRETVSTLSHAFSS